ncbi:MAG: cysteine synthase A [Nitrospira sp.]|nr:cysteine synthase A [Nitrospira sp.]
MKKPFFYSKPVDSVLDLIGNTPMVRINRLVPEGSADIYAKIESFNPCKSVKDRICLAMVQAAEKDGKIRKGDTLIEPTSGNTGIGLAFVGAAKGYKIALTMPETMSMERRNMLKSLGANLILTDGTRDMTGAMEMAKTLAEEKHYHQLQQFANPANPEAHRQTTAQEILNQLKDVDAFVAGVGTGGTLTGVGEILKQELGAQVRVIAVEPAKSSVLSGGNAGLHDIQGIGAGFIPDTLNRSIIDDIIQVTDDEAIETTRLIMKQEGILCGISSGANLFAAIKIAKLLGAGKKVVTMFCDTGERYLSTRLFESENESNI